MNKIAPKTKIRSIFLCEGKHFYGEIISYQEPTSYLAEGYFIKWEEVLGYEVFEYTISKVGRTRLAEALLYEITWFGFTDYDNNKAIKEFNEELKRIEKSLRK